MNERELNRIYQKENLDEIKLSDHFKSIAKFISNDELIKFEEVLADYLTKIELHAQSKDYFRLETKINTVKAFQEIIEKDLFYTGDGCAYTQEPLCRTERAKMLDYAHKLCDELLKNPELTFMQLLKKEWKYPNKKLIKEFLEEIKSIKSIDKKQFADELQVEYKNGKFEITWNEKKENPN